MKLSLHINGGDKICPVNYVTIKQLPHKYTSYNNIVVTFPRKDKVFTSPFE